MKELKAAGTNVVIAIVSLEWNPVKELKVSRRPIFWRIHSFVWNPVKELKVAVASANKAGSLYGFVESGEGIESFMSF